MLTDHLNVPVVIHVLVAQVGVSVEPGVEIIHKEGSKLGAK